MPMYRHLTVKPFTPLDTDIETSFYVASRTAEELYSKDMRRGV